MRTITTVTNVYTIDELDGREKQAALEVISQRRTETFHEFYLPELIESMKVAAQAYHMEVVDYSIGLFTRNHVRVDVEEYMGLDNSEKNGLVAWLNGSIQAGVEGKCEFTGTFYDSYFFDYFKENGPTSYNAVHKDIPKAIEYMLDKAIDDEERSILSDEDNENYAKDPDIEFLSDGSLYS